MRKILFLICILCLGCNSNTRYIDSTNDTPKVKTINEEYIWIDAEFVPTLEITDDIKNTSLEDLIKQEKGHFTPAELKKIKNYSREHIIT